MYTSKLKGYTNEEDKKQQDFPIACESCFGESPYMTMSKEENGKECKICSKPFCVFRWKPGAGSRFKKTEICKTCSLVKNVCQVCIHDLEFGLPVQVRDAAFQSIDNAPIVSDLNRIYMANQHEKMIESGEINYDNFQPTEIIEKLARSTPYYKKNQPHICSFFLKGECNRGASCPYRHDTQTGKFPKQNIKDRYYGTNDPVAMKMLKSVTPTPPEDQSITTLYLGNVDPERVSEENLRSSFFSFGIIKSLRLVPSSKCAFITFESREAAETAMSQLFNKLVFDDIPIQMGWSKLNKPQPNSNNNNNNNNNKFNQKKSTDTKENEETETDNNKVNNDNNNNNNNNNDNDDDDDEDKDLPLFSIKPTPTPAPPVNKPMGIKSLPTFKINPTPQGTNASKPYYAAMDPNSYGGRL